MDSPHFLDPVDTERLQTIVNRLRFRTSASRTTVRVLDGAGQPRLVAESLSADVASMYDGPPPAITAAPTYTEIETTREILVQNDCRTDGPRPPELLIEHYRVYAQMLAPVFDATQMIATLSVHQQDQPRRWSTADIAALRAAGDEVGAVLIPRD